ncbi:ankyrin-2-like [Schistocerca serialis cubense]|uniref:ankyrin-2-like n=1 Tax=Schistocerca serialis cubense TaxID=2023355 RepID=UPI00214E5325|nr:ankyrin-2-like [Schistocerca serialis cubense]
MEAVKDVKKSMAVNLGDLMDAGDDAMVILVAGDTRLVVHRAVLVDRSPVFEAMFAHDTLEASSGAVSIADVGGPVLRQLVSYLYTLQAPQLPSAVPELLATADKYGLLSLKAECERQVAAQLTVETAAAAATLAVRHSCCSLRQAALAFIKSCPFEVMATQGWADAMRKQPEDLIEVSRLLYDPPPQTSTPVSTQLRPTAAATTTTTAATTTSTLCQTPAAAALSTSPPLDEATVSRLRSLSADERDRRLIKVANQGSVGELRELLAAGADVGARSTAGFTALHYVAVRGDVKAARWLVKAGAALDARSNCQNMPLHLAALRGNAAVVQLLLTASADPNARASDGLTPLHCAALNGHAEAAAKLLEAGADRRARTDNGRTAVDFARVYSTQLMQILS